MAERSRRSTKDSRSQKKLAFTPKRLRGRADEDEDKEDEGPRSWFLETIESCYARLSPSTEEAEVAPPIAMAMAAKAAGTVVPPIAQPPKAVWLDVLTEYRRRKKGRGPSDGRVTRTTAPVPGAPAVPGGRNWLPLGPTVVLDGQTVGGNPVGGRVSGIAVVPGGHRLFVATANGGVFRSDDGATTWRAMMDSFDIDPTSFASTSLAWTQHSCNQGQSSGELGSRSRPGGQRSPGSLSLPAKKAMPASSSDISRILSMVPFLSPPTRTRISWPGPDIRVTSRKVARALFPGLGLDEFHIR